MSIFLAQKPAENIKNSIQSTFGTIQCSPNFLAGRSMPGAEALRLVFIGDFNQRVVGRQVIAIQ